VGRLAFEVPEFFEATDPMTFATEAAMLALIIGGLEQAFMWAVSLIDDL
jgi:hypothetical protein